MVFCSETLFGVDTDRVLAFTTKKVVWIRNRWIGGLYYLFVVSIILWLAVGRILFMNDHFVRKDVAGVARMWYSHPTQQDCESTQHGCLSDYERLIDLPYCDVYRGVGGSDKKAHCEFLGKVSLVPDSSSENELFITTAVEVVTERRACNPGKENGFVCPNEYEALKGTDCLRNDIYLCKNRSGLKNQFYYVADATDYRVQFTTSYERGDLRGTSLMHRGHVALCQAQNRIGNETRTWTQRQGATREECGSDQTDTIPCAEGATCAPQTRSFNLFRDSGLQKLITGEDDDEDETNEASDSDATATTPALQTPPSYSHDQGGSKRAREPVVPALTATGRHTPRAPVLPTAVRAHLPTGSWGRSLLQTMQQTEPSHAALLLQAASSAERTGDAALRSESQNQPFKEYSNPWGDVFSVARLLELAGADLDRDFNMDGWSARQGGIALEVSAVYNNLYPVLSTFGYRPVRYHYDVRELKLPYVSRSSLSKVQPDDYPVTRRYEVRYGVLIYFKVAGQFGTFSKPYLLSLLATVFALTAAGKTVTDKIALYIHSHRVNFFHLKYDVSPDFSDLWTCPKCGFENRQEHEYCQRIPMWYARGEVPACGEPRPQKSPSSSMSPST